MEAAAMGDKDWFMRGEAQAGASSHCCEEGSAFNRPESSMLHPQYQAC